MDFRKLNINTWNLLDSSGSAKSGYKGIWLSEMENKPSALHIFKDESGKFHFAIEVSSNPRREDVIDPKLNGLSMSVNHYQLNGANTKAVVDIQCNFNGYLAEFTQVTKEICTEILVKGKTVIPTINEVILKWITFWDSQKRKTLSEEKQIGLVCELNVLIRLCNVDPSKAIKSWVGPFEERHDFMFDKSSVEVKGTRRTGRIHTINGLDQLQSFPNKSLGFISSIVTIVNSASAISLPQSIEKVYEVLQSYPNLIVRFNELLAQVGYSPVDDDEYKKFRIEILDVSFFPVDNSFPRLTAELVTTPHIERVSCVRYDISLEGIKGKSLNEINWRELLITS
jgi:hypothetical protein